jgi:uncharacterized protein (TIGR01777 family)
LQIANFQLQIANLLFENPLMRIFIAGGTGLVGTRLVTQLLARKDEVVVLTRRPEVAKEKWGDTCTIVSGDPMQAGPWMDTIAACDAVVNLVGENIFARRWRAWFIDLLRDSRVKSTENIVAALTKNPHTKSGQPKVLVNASAIGFYGPHGDEELDESNAHGDDLLARVCIDWEKAAQAVTAAGVRLVILRVGVVLDKAGGALAKMLTPFKMFVGGPIGAGRQYVSWIHHEDMAGLILLGLDNGQASGPLNGTAPRPETNRAFSKALGRALHRPSFMRTPKFMLRLMLGKVASVITSGQRVLPRKALELGYTFKFADIDSALRDVLAS